MVSRLAIFDSPIHGLSNDNKIIQFNQPSQIFSLSSVKYWVCICLETLFRETNSHNMRFSEKSEKNYTNISSNIKKNYKRNYLSTPLHSRDLDIPETRGNRVFRFKKSYLHSGVITNFYFMLIG